MGVNILPKTVTRQRRDCDLNPGPSAPESSTLTTRLPSHPLAPTLQWAGIKAPRPLHARGTSSNTRFRWRTRRESAPNGNFDFILCNSNFDYIGLLYYNLLLCFIQQEIHVRLICAIKFYFLIVIRSAVYLFIHQSTSSRPSRNTIS